MIGLFAAAPILKVVGMAAVPLVIAGGLAAAWHVASSYGANKVMVAQYARIAAKNRSSGRTEGEQHSRPRTAPRWPLSSG